MVITRRQILAAGIGGTATLAVTDILRSTKMLALEPAEVLTFFDPRFPRSQLLAQALPRASQLLAVRGDPSPLLARIAPNAVPRGGLRLQGITTEAVPFCLEQLSRRDHDVALDSQRLDRDLFAWALMLRKQGPAA